MKTLLRFAHSILIIFSLMSLTYLWGDEVHQEPDIASAPAGKLLEKLGYGNSGWNIHHMNEQPRSFDQVDYDIKDLDVWVTLNPKYETLENLSFYSTLWLHLTGLHFMNEIQGTDFTLHPDAFCVITWFSYEGWGEDMGDDSIIYRVFRSEATDEKEVEHSNALIVYEGKEPRYYVPIDSLIKPGEVICWIEAISPTGILISKSDYFRI